MSRAQLQQYAEDRILDVQTLLAGSRWSGAYYLAGYAAECGLKSCVLHHIEKTGMIFKDKEYLARLGKCWTHSLEQLVQLAELKKTLDDDCRANGNLFANWAVAFDWKETSRYDVKNEAEARGLFDAIANATDGVLPWIKRHW